MNVEGERLIFECLLGERGEHSGDPDSNSYCNAVILTPEATNGTQIHQQATTTDYVHDNSLWNQRQDLQSRRDKNI